MIKNDEQWIRNILVPHLLQNGNLVKDYSQSKPFILTTVSIEYLGTKESFMLTICYKAKINFEYCGKEYSKFFVIKKTPDISEDAYEAVNFDTLFHNEITVYTEIIPAAGYSHNYPEYFYSDRGKLEAVLVLGDFSIDGWRMTKDRVNLSLEHILLSVNLLGKFHGEGFAFKVKNPNKFKLLVSSLKEARYAKEPPPHWSYLSAHCMERPIQAARQYYPEIPNEFLNNLSNLVDNVFTYGQKKVLPVEPLSTLCHGDFLRNNLAYKYTAEDMPIDILMFDCQTFRYSSPMVDLCVLMCFDCGKNTRSKYFEKIFQKYYSALVDTFSQQLNISVKDLPEFLSFRNLMKEYVLYLPFGLGIASTFLMHLYQPRSESPSEFLEPDISPEEELQDTLTRGGDIVNEQLAAIVNDLYKLTIEHKVDIFGDNN